MMLDPSALEPGRLPTTPLTALDRVDTHARPVVWADELTTVREAARAMTDARQSAVVVRYVDGTVAIATDQDFRLFLSTASPQAERPVAEIASSPARTVPAEASVAAALLEMLEHGIHHLIVTDTRGAPAGVVRVIDLVSAEARDPFAIREAIDTAVTVEATASAAAALPTVVVDLAELGVAPLRIAALSSTLREQILRRIVELSSDETLSHVAVSWLALGSLARREALPSSDIDTAVVWLGTDEAHDPAVAVHRHAEHVLTSLERSGLNRCPDGANATNGLFCRSVDDWVAAMGRWIDAPTATGSLLLASFVTDSRAVTNRNYAAPVVQAAEAAAAAPEFLATLLAFILQNKAPTTRLHPLVLDEHGELDLKSGGLLPLAGLGRWIALATGDVSGTTIERIQRGAGAGLISTDDAAALTGAYEEVYGILFARDLAAVRSGNSAAGSRVAPSDLDPLTRNFLRDTFREIAAVQKHLYATWASRPGGGRRSRRTKGP